MSSETILEIIAAISATVTTIATIWFNSQRRQDKKELVKISEKNAAKSSIQNMITQDILRTEVLKKLPENRDNIEAEYEIYHKNGGNGTVTRQVNEYFDWYNAKQELLTKKK